MPRLSDSMEEGTIVRWLKSDGDEVKRGEALVEIETDKATMTYEADQDGTLQIVAEEGATLAIGEVIAQIGEPSGDGGAPEPDGEGEKSAESQDDHDTEETADAEREPSRQPAPARARDAGDGDGGERLKASPVARRIAHELGVELRALEGSGPGGRIVKADVEAAADAGGAQVADREDGGPERADRPPEREPATARGETEVKELTRAQQLIARRMAESRATVPDFTLQVQVDMEAAVQAREQLRELSGDDPVPSLNDMVVKACALTLRRFPRVNGSYRDGHFELHSRVNVGVAVAAQDALIVPVVFDADRRPLGEIARTTRELAEKVRAGKISPPELSGATFTVSNLGMYGISSFTAVINPPQAAILAVGAVEQRPVVRDDELVVRHTMAMTMGCDHRILYGADAAEFLGRVRALLEAPAGLAL